MPMRIPKNIKAISMCDLETRDPTVDELKAWKVWLDREIKLVDQAIFDQETLPRIMALPPKESKTPVPPKPKEK